MDRWVILDVGETRALSAAGLPAVSNRIQYASPAA